MEVVVGLEQHVAELGEGDALLGPLDTRLHRLLGDHLVDGEVLADVPEEVDEPVRAEPIRVVQEQPLGLPRRRRQVEEAPELTPDRLEVGRELLEGEESAFVGLASRVADQPGAAPGEQDRGDGRRAAAGAR